MVRSPPRSSLSTHLIHQVCLVIFPHIHISFIWRFRSKLKRKIRKRNKRSNDNDVFCSINNSTIVAASPQRALEPGSCSAHKAGSLQSDTEKSKGFLESGWSLVSYGSCKLWI